jgi:hypothetical protein
LMPVLYLAQDSLDVVLYRCPAVGRVGGPHGVRRVRVRQIGLGFDLWK